MAKEWGVNTAHYVIQGSRPHQHRKKRHTAEGLQQRQRYGYCDMHQYARLKLRQCGGWYSIPSLDSLHSLYTGRGSGDPLPYGSPGNGAPSFLPVVQRQSYISLG